MRGVDFEREGGPLFWHAVRDDTPTQILRHQIANAVHTEPDLTRPDLCREAGIEDACKDIRRHTPTIVMEQNFYLAAPRELRLYLDHSSALMIEDAFVHRED